MHLLLKLVLFGLSAVREMKRCHMGITVSCFAISIIVRGSNITKMGLIFTALQVLKSAGKVLLFILTFEWEPCLLLPPGMLPKPEVSVLGVVAYLNNTLLQIYY